MRSRNMTAVALLASAALVLAGCSGGSKPSENTGSAKDGGTLTFASFEWQEAGRGAPLWDAVSAYMKVNPAATLKKLEVTRADFERTMSTQIGAGGGPDILIIPDPFFPTLAASGALEPLDKVVAAVGDKVLRASNDTYVVDGKQLSLVWEANPYGLYWNKKIIDQAGVTPPTTFDQLVQAAKTVKEKTGKIGFVVRHQLNEATPWWFDYSNWPYGFGGSWSQDGKLTINSPENIKAAAALKEIYSSGAFGIGDDASTYRSKFAAGEIGFVLDNAGSVKQTLASSKVLLPADVGSSVLPFPGGGSVYVGNSLGINAHSKNKALAKDFLRWMYSTKDVQTALAAAFFPEGVGTNARAPQDMYDANPWAAPFLKQLEHSKSVIIEGFGTKTPQISLIVLTQVQKMLTSDMSAKEAMNTAQKQAEALG